mgnify:CR=1 FL=1
MQLQVPIERKLRLHNVHYVLFLFFAGAFYGGAMKPFILMLLLFLTNTWYILTLSSDTSAVFEIIRKFVNSSRNSMEDSYNSRVASFPTSTPTKKSE